MSDEVNGGTYRSPLREEQARRTRMRVAQAARDLLVARGYSGVTMADIAAAAGVSVPLLYKAFGAKPELVKQVYDILMTGDDDPTAVADRPDARAVAAAPDPRAKIERYARMGRYMAGRAGPFATVLRNAARAGEAELRPFLETTDAERLVGAGRMAEHLAEVAALRPGVDVDRARDLIWLATSPEAFQLLVVDRGWSLDDYEAWLAAALCRDLLPGPQ
jgi:AcrR family transcriptional regulator